MESIPRTRCAIVLSLSLLFVGAALLVTPQPVSANTGSCSAQGGTNSFGTVYWGSSCTVASTQTWGNGTLTIAGSMTVSSGTLTLWNMVVKFSQGSDYQYGFGVSGTLVVRWGGLQSNNSYHWQLFTSGSGRVDLSYTNVSTTTTTSTTASGVDLHAGASGQSISHSHLTDTRTYMTTNAGYFGYNNVSDFDDSHASPNQWTLRIGSNGTVEHNTFWNITEGAQPVIQAYKTWTVNIFANTIYMKVNGTNAMGVEIINAQPEQTPVKSTWPTTTVTWNNVTFLKGNGGGQNSNAFDNEYSYQVYLANNSVTIPSGAGGVTECLESGGMEHSVIVNNHCNGSNAFDAFDYGIYQYIYDGAFNTWANNDINHAYEGIILQAGNNTFYNNVFDNITTGYGIYVCSSAPCAGSGTATTHNLWYNNTFTQQATYTSKIASILSNTFTTSPGILHMIPKQQIHYGSDFNYYGNFAWWMNQTVDYVEWSNASGSQCLKVKGAGKFGFATPSGWGGQSSSIQDCYAGLGTTGNQAVKVDGPVATAGTMNSGGATQQTWLKRLGKDNTTFNFVTASAAQFYLNWSSLYSGATYNIKIWNYSSSSYDLNTQFVATSGFYSYAHGFNGRYNVTIAYVSGGGGGTTPPVAQTNAASPVGTTTATLNGYLNSMGSASSVSVGFLWGTNSTLSGASNVTAPESPLSTTGAFTYPLTGLSTGSKYYFRAWADGDGFATGSILNFTTASISPPSVSTVAASSIGPTTADINGNLASLGSAASVTVGFLWGTSPTLIGATNVTVATLSGTGTFQKSLITLPSNTTHYFQTWANGDGFATGSILSFATLPVPPSVSSSAATAITTTNATLNGNVAALGSWASVQEGFLYGTSPSLAGATNHTVGLAGSTGTFLASLTLLSASTPYYFSAWTKGSSFVQGSILTFTTNATAGGGGGSGGGACFGPICFPPAPTLPSLPPMSMPDIPLWMIAAAAVGVVAVVGAVYTRREGYWSSCWRSSCTGRCRGRTCRSPSSRRWSR